MKHRLSLDLQHGSRVYLMLHGVRSGIRAQRKRLPKKAKKKKTSNTIAPPILFNFKAQFIRRASAVPNLILELSST